MILDYKIAATWDLIINKKLIEVLGVSYPERIKKNAGMIPYRDSDFEACNLFIELANRERIREVVIEELSRNFDEVIAYHACRPSRIDDYYEKGIVPLSPIDAQNQFRDYFRPYASQEDIEKAIAAIPLDTRDGVVHIVIDDRDFVDTCGHYLIYGGEYLHCLAIHLPGATEHTRDILKQFGNATVFVCRLPFSYLTDLEYLASTLIADHCYRIARNRDDVCKIDYTITIEETIPPDAIVSHYCPTRIKDPHKCYAVWNDITMNYE